MSLNATPYLEQVREEYEKISRKWLSLHFKVLGGLVLASALLEIVMCFVLNRIQLVTAGLEEYVYRYLLAPIAVNFLLLLFTALLLQSSRLSFQWKQYVLSLSTLAVCFSLFTIHCAFPSLVMLFVAAVLLTTIYGDYLLTTVTALCGMAGFSISELLIFWDSSKVMVLAEKNTAVNFILTLLILLGFYLMGLTIIFFQRQKNLVILQKEMERQRLKAELLRDSLTGLYNRNALRESFNEMLRSGQPHVFAMVDLNHFKQLNDTYGHPRGDICLREFADIAQREADPHPVFRYGGDEFCILFRLETPEEAAEICRRIHRQLAQSVTLSPLSLQASFGLALYEPGMTPQQLLNHADRALYRSKCQENPIAVFTEDMEPSPAQA